MKVMLAQEAPRMMRKTRNPQHTFQIRQRPWQIQPFMIAPVLPGETLKNLTMQARVVSDPLKSKLVGWWYETYFFYVKHRDLAARDDLVAMHLTGASLAAYKAGAAVVPSYTFKGAVDWQTMCLTRIVEQWFRDEGETWNADLIDTLPVAQINRDMFIDSVVDNTVSPPAENVLQDGGGSDDGIISTYQAMWDRMRQMRQTNMSFEDWLRMQGVSGVKTPEKESSYKPELVRYDREWTYPTNTVEPTTGVPSSAAVWSTQIRADKDRFFKEPGFLVGVQVVRPKVYLSSLKGAGVGALDEARLWLPSILADEPYTSIKQHVVGGSNDGPLGTVPTNGYWIDYRDLFIYGDQFVNFDIATAGDGNSVALPTAALKRRYADSTMANNLFLGAAPANVIRSDGVVSLNILGTVGADQT